MTIMRRAKAKAQVNKLAFQILPVSQAKQWLIGTRMITASSYLKDQRELTETNKMMLKFSLSNTLSKNKKANSMQMIQAYQDRFAKEKQAPKEDKKESDRSKSREAA